MTKHAFKVEGDFQMGRRRQHFSLETVAPDEKGAREHIFTDLGSRHGVERRQIAITSVTKLSADAIEHAVTAKKLKA